MIVGFGDVAKRLLHYIPARYRVYALVRNARAATEAEKLGVRAVRGDLSNPLSLCSLPAADLVFHFAPPPARGRHDTHTRHMVNALDSRRAAMLPQRLIYISTTGVYGDCAGNWINETRPTHPASARAKRRVDAETVLSRWARRRGLVLSILRAPGIYAADRLPVARLMRGAPALQDIEDVFTNHIHADDLARAAWQAARFGRGIRVYNAVDDSALKMGEYFDLVARQFKLPPPPRISRAEAERALSPELLSFMRESRRIENARIKRELRLTLKYPTVETFLAGLPER